MLPRRHVEEFIAGEWKEDPGHDGKEYRVRTRVNGEEEPFPFEVSISGTAICTEVKGLDQILRNGGWEEIARREITHAVRNGCLDGQSPSERVCLKVESSDLDALISPDVL